MGGLDAGLDDDLVIFGILSPHGSNSIVSLVPRVINSGGKVLFDHVHSSMLCCRDPSSVYSPMVGESQDPVGEPVLSCAANPSCNWDSAVMVGSFPGVSDNPLRLIGWVPPFSVVTFVTTEQLAGSCQLFLGMVVPLHVSVLLAGRLTACPSC